MLSIEQTGSEANVAVAQHRKPKQQAGITVHFAVSGAQKGSK